MIRGISDLDYNDAEHLLTAIIEKAGEEDKALRKEQEDKKIEILLHEYYKRLEAEQGIKGERDKAIEACNKRIEEIEEEIYAIKERKDYFIVQLEMVCGKQPA